MGDWFLDVRTGLRQLRRAPGLSIAAIVTLAVGIGATTGSLSFTAAVLAVSRPVDDIDRRVGLWSFVRGDMEAKRAVSPADFLDIRDRATSIDQVVANRDRSFNVSGSGLPVRTGGSEVTPGFLEFLQQTPAAGRTFSADDAREGAPRVVILSELFWRTEMGSRPGLIGETLRIDGAPATIVGILAPRSGFAVGGILVPLSLDAVRTDRSDRSLFVWARLKPGVTIGQARAEMEGIAQALEREHPQTNRGWTINTTPLREEFLGTQARVAFAILIGMAVTVLLTGCVNIANLLLARGVARRAEIAVRMALGAGQWRIARQLLVECAVIAFLGAAASVFIGRAVLAALVSTVPLESRWLQHGGFNVRLLALTALAALLTTVAAGLAPALAARRASLRQGMYAAGREAPAASRGRMTRLLIGAQVGLAVMLLIIAGLLTRSINALRSLDPGFDVTHALTAGVALPATIADVNAVHWFEQAIERAGALPGVVSAAATSRLPFAGSRFNPNRGLVVDGRVESPGDAGAFAIDYVVTPGYLATMKAPLKAGRDFTRADAADAPYVAIISETLAKRYWPGRSPIGGRLREGDEPAGVWRTVVGVVGDIRNDDADQPPLPYLYIPLAQRPQHAMSIVIRTTGPPEALADALRKAMAAFDPDQPLFDVQSMEAILDADMRQAIIFIQILDGLALVALGLAALGIWGVMAQAVAARTREIGVRMALGATPSDVLGSMARFGLLPVAVGLGAGFAGGLGAARLMRVFLFQVKATDPATLAAACVLLAVAAVVACIDPVRRALRLDPAQVLRLE